MQSSNSDSATHPMEKIKECYNFMENQINESVAIIRRNFTRIQNAVFQGCISCGILVSSVRARGVSSEHMENMEMFSCSPT